MRGSHANTPLSMCPRSRICSNIGYEKDGSRSQTSSSGAATGSGRSTTASTSVKTVVIPPIPQASASTAARVSPGVRRNCRSAKRMSCDTWSNDRNMKSSATSDDPRRRDRCAARGKARAEGAQHPTRHRNVRVIAERR
jgi:hypothetical protein